MSLQTDLTAVGTDILALIEASKYLGDLPAASILTLSPPNVANGTWTPFQLVAGGDASLTANQAVDGVHFKLRIAGYATGVQGSPLPRGRILVQVDNNTTGATILEIDNMAGLGSAWFYQELGLMYSSVPGNGFNVALDPVGAGNRTIPGSFSPASTTPSFYLSGGFDYTSPQTYNSGNTITITEFRLVQ